MDKKNIIIIVMSVVIVALVAAVFVMSSGVPKVSKDVVMTINGTDYSVDEFTKYMYIRYEESGDIAHELSPEETDHMLNDFWATKLYVQAANSKLIVVPDEEIDSFKEDYKEKAATFKPYGVAESDYVKYCEDQYKEDELSMKFTEYYELPEQYYNDFVKSYSGDQKTYDFRMMTFYYEEEKSGDAVVSGDVSGDTTKDVTENVSGDVGSGDEEKEDKSRATILATAEDVLAKVRSGDDFGELAKEYGSYRYTFQGSGYTLINGDLEHATTAVLESKIGNDELYHAVLDLEAGETTDIVEDAESRMLYFVKVEQIQDGFVGEGKEELLDILLMEYEETLIMENAKYEINSGALMRLLYQ